MANIQSPYGFRLIDTEGKEVKGRRYPKLAVNIYEGDPVIADPAGSGAVTIATAGSVLVGVSGEYRASTDLRPILIYDNPDCTFEVQASANFVQADVFLNANFIVGAGNAALHRSTCSLDSTSYATTSSLPLKVVGLSNGNANNAYGSYAEVLVKINSSWLSSGTTGV